MALSFHYNSSSTNYLTFAVLIAQQAPSFNYPIGYKVALILWFSLMVLGI